MSDHVCEEIDRLETACHRLEADLAAAQGRADAGWQGLRNIYRIATGDDCETNLALGLATSAVAERIRERNSHRLRADEAEREQGVLKARLAEVERELHMTQNRSLASHCHKKGHFSSPVECGCKMCFDALRARCEAMRDALARIKDETILGRSHELGTRIYDLCNAALAAQEPRK